MINKLIAMLKQRNPKINIIIVDKQTEKSYDVTRKVYSDNTLESWVDSCLELIDDTKPLYLWGVDVIDIEDRQEILVYGSMTFKG